MYQIQPYTYSKASLLGVTVAPSKNPLKKLDVFDLDGNYICSVGARQKSKNEYYSDYPTYLKTKDKAYADERRRLYKIRHQHNRHEKGSAGYYSDNLLW